MFAEISRIYRRVVLSPVHAEYTPRSLAGFGVTGVDCMSGKLDFTETFTDFEFFLDLKTAQRDEYVARTFKSRRQKLILKKTCVDS